MLGDLDLYRAALTDEVREGALWNTQAATLIETYGSLVGVPRRRPRAAHHSCRHQRARPTGYDSDFVARTWSWGLETWPGRRIASPEQSRAS